MIPAETVQMSTAGEERRSRAAVTVQSSLKGLSVSLAAAAAWYNTQLLSSALVFNLLEQQFQVKLTITSVSTPATSLSGD